MASRLETLTYVLTLLAAVAGISFLLVNRRLQVFSKAESDTLHQKIAETNALGEAAKADAATARAQVEEYKTERTRLELRLKGMESAQSKLSETNAENEQELAKLRENAKPRTISPAQSSQIASLLKPFSGQAVQINVYAQDNETMQFVGMIVLVLHAAGIQTTQFNVMSGSGTGLFVVVHDAQSAPPLAGTIQHAFMAAGIDMGA